MRFIIPLVAVAGLAVAAVLFLGVPVDLPDVPGLPSLGPPPGDAEGAGFLRFRVGDRFTYQAVQPDGSSATVEIRVLAPRPALAANHSRVVALPLVMRLVGADSPVDAYLIDVEHGGLVLSVEGCVVDPSLPCRDSASSYVTWQECPFNGGFSPADMVPRARLGEPRLTISDPLKPASTWTYTLRSEAGGLVRMDLETASVARSLCGGAEGFLLDPREGTVREAVTPGAILRLQGVQRGAGPEVVLGGGPPQASALLVPRARDAYPPGLESRGPSAFLFGEAWTRANEEPALRDFLARRPEAFVYGATNTTSRAELVEGSVRQTTYEWRIQVLAPDRSMVEAVVTKDVTQGVVPRTSARITQAVPPADVPPRFHPPAKEVVDLQEFLRRAAELGYRSDPRFLPGFHVSFDGEDADYGYTLILGGTTTRVGIVEASTSNEALVFNADTGRITDVTVPLAEARAMAGAS